MILFRRMTKGPNKPLGTLLGVMDVRDTAGFPCVTLEFQGPARSERFAVTMMAEEAETLAGMLYDAIGKGGMGRGKVG